MKSIGQNMREVYERSLDTRTHKREPLTEVEQLRLEVMRLRRRVDELEQQLAHESWRSNPDRMGS